MSMICRMIVGYFDAPERAVHRDAPVWKSLDSATVAELESVCAPVLGREIHLAHFVRHGVLEVTDGAITDWMFQVACVAHERFGMEAVDDAHRSLVYPCPWESRRDALARVLRRLHPERTDDAIQTIVDARMAQRRQRQDAVLIWAVGPRGGKPPVTARPVDVAPPVEGEQRVYVAYELPPPGQLLRALEQDDVPALARYVLGVANVGGNVETAIALSTLLSSHWDAMVRGNAISSLGHIARVFGRGLGARQLGIVRSASNDPSEYVRGHADSARDDIEQFLGVTVSIRAQDSLDER